MESTADVFEVIFNEKKIPVKEVTMAGRPLFLVGMDAGKPLVITQATSNEGQLFWTSIPEGQQALAVSIGKLIDAHFRKTN
ncbi:hypothetical protein HB364_17445 [Pseudoflavitalea sp. X16]|uniref:hypothetical protein n=1 Tax=Paraflavitalea devenefica TaxID=2716334 RepID=UPI00142176DB|nr:hypothetical protein [Paraflavitalea devenefica]NII26879.1 hypothetical protein [Paraflavitalea devenefica]